MADRLLSLLRSLSKQRLNLANWLAKAAGQFCAFAAPKAWPTEEKSGWPSKTIAAPATRR